MKRAILIIMAMLMMASMASASYDVAYRQEETPKHMILLYSNITAMSERFNLLDNYTTIDIDRYIDLSDAGLSSLETCVEIYAPGANISFVNASGELIRTSIVDICGHVHGTTFDVFYKQLESPKQLRLAFSNTPTDYNARITLNQNAVVRVQRNIDLSDAGEEFGTLESCIEIETAGNNIAINDLMSSTHFITNIAYICEHKETTPPEPVIEPTCNDSDIANDVHILGTVSGIDTTGTDFAWNDECDTLSAKVIEGKCIAASVGSLVEYEYKDCPTGEVCFLGVCRATLTGDRLREKLWEDITARIRGIKIHLNNIEKSACGAANLPTGKAVAANNAVNVNSFSNLEVELTKIYEQQARIAKCKGLATAKFTKAASSESNVASLIAVTTKQTYDLKKATLKAGGKVSVDKTPAVEATKTPAVKTPITATKTPSLLSRLFGTKTPA